MKSIYKSGVIILLKSVKFYLIAPTHEETKQNNTWKRNWYTNLVSHIRLREQ